MKLWVLNVLLYIDALNCQTGWYKGDGQYRKCFGDNIGSDILAFSESDSMIKPTEGGILCRNIYQEFLMKFEWIL